MLEQIGKLARFSRMINLKTIYFNLKYFPLRVAMKLPVLVSRHVTLKKLKGSIQLQGPVVTGQVRIGYNDVSLFDRRRSKTMLELDGVVTFRGKALIGHGSRISVAPTGRLTFGADFEITAQSSIVCYHEIEFGADCLLSWDILLMDTDLHPIYNSAGACINAPRKITLGDHVWVGCRTTILKGSNIASGSVVAAGSTISGKLAQSNSIYGSNRILKEDIHWKH